jgi:protein SCO1/2
VLLLPLIAALAFVIFQPIQVLPRMDLAPGFSLVDQGGERFTNEDLRGKLTLYSISYSRCAEACPDTTGTMAELVPLVNGLDLGGLPVRFVSISVDPDYDTPELLATHARQVGADGELWRFVTGDPVHVKQIVGAGFGAYYGVGAGEEMAVEFDPIFVLVDGWGIQRAVYRTDSPDPEIIRRDFGLIAREVENSEGVNRFAYEAAHLFLCFPS